VLAILLIVGLYVGQQFLSSPAESQTRVFREWFWENRSLDLAVQISLIFVGALGIAALLPRERGKSEEEQ